MTTSLRPSEETERQDGRERLAESVRRKRAQHWSDSSFVQLAIIVTCTTLSAFEGKKGRQEEEGHEVNERTAAADGSHRQSGEVFSLRERQTLQALHCMPWW